ncbi:hypothetical protein D3C83_134650 [compost metagenome]
MKAVPRNSGARKMRIFAESVSSSARPAPASANFTAITPTASGTHCHCPACAIPHGMNSAMPSAQ